MWTTAQPAPADRDPVRRRARPPGRRGDRELPCPADRLAGARTRRGDLRARRAGAPALRPADAGRRA
ncbi:hypothetical protein G5V59_03825 [Nocardioides sp. W3-2-3]|uniref:hypothetical protein n=1 Tax=Nocardioides convexus TaxID=2712224 RepID=UPI00241835E6|nr:hypothetical protein [Nocardioides convexus]NGZ99764.1 hypothetical protein [Nocardioides convexus]